MRFPDPNKSMLDNARRLIPPMFDRFMSHKPGVLRYPRIVRRLHTMRVEGKSLRYTLELFRAGLGREFALCYSEVRRLISLMGRIHDCDVAIRILADYLGELRIPRKTNRPSAKDFSSDAVATTIAATRGDRDRLFGELARILEDWEENDFRGKLVHAVR